SSSLLFVLALFGVGAYLLSRQGQRFGGLLPDEVVRVLGRRYLDQRHSIQLIRCGSKILVLVNSTQHGLTTLAEITDPREVELITEQCLQPSAGESSGSFERTRTDAPHQKITPVTIPESLTRSGNAAGGNRG